MNEHLHVESLVDTLKDLPDTLRHLPGAVQDRLDDVQKSVGNLTGRRRRKRRRALPFLLGGLVLAAVAAMAMRRRSMVDADEGETEADSHASRRVAAA